MVISVEEIQHPHPRIVHVWAMKAFLVPLLLWLVVAIPLSAFYFATTPPEDPFGIRATALIAGVAVLLLAIGYGWAFLYRSFYRWQLTESDLRVWRGILFRKRITIPYMRVQNVNVVRGPLLLLFGLSSVEVETAGQKGMYYGGFYPTEGFLPGLVDGDAVADGIVEKVKGAKAREGL